MPCLVSRPGVTTAIDIILVLIAERGCKRSRSHPVALSTSVAYLSPAILLRTVDLPECAGSPVQSLSSSVDEFVRSAMSR